MPSFTVVYGEQVKQIEVPQGITIGDAIVASGLPLEQPCAGRGTCGLCKVLVESGASEPDEIEREHLTPGEIALENRLACRARVLDDMKVVLSPIVVYSNKIFRSSSRYKRTQSPLGVAVDLGSTTVAAFLTMLDDLEVQAGGAGLNQQTVFGADVISRLAAAVNNPENAERLQRLALASINHAVDTLKLSDRIRSRIERIVIVSNVAMHHLLARMPLTTLASKPFQPFDRRSIRHAESMMGGIFSENVQVSLPPLIGGFVGSDALACLAYFGFREATKPMAAIDLGTNGEVMVTDGRRILTASTAAGPAFEGVNISCGSRAVDGAIVQARMEGEDLLLTTIADEKPVGLTGSGLLSTVYALRKAGVIEPSGRIPETPPYFLNRLEVDRHGARKIPLTHENQLWLTQWDIRELQKAKGAIRAAVDVLMRQLELKPDDLDRIILTGSFGGQVDIEAVLDLGMIPPVRREAVQTIANGAGLGAAMFLSDEGFAYGEELAVRAEQIDLDQDANFYSLYIQAMTLASNGNFSPVKSNL
jgi:uncharacterized 2Fe-2S/4Fe-4S cluster protein (DUF4445 family)